MDLKVKVKGVAFVVRALGSFASFRKKSDTPGLESAELGSRAKAAIFLPGNLHNLPFLG